MTGGRPWISALLLDTHALVWAVGTPERLSAAARTQIEERENELFVSAAAAWELGTGYRLGTLPEAETLVQQYRSVLDALGPWNRPSPQRTPSRAGGFRWTHRDPFDRMLVA